VETMIRKSPTRWVGNDSGSPVITQPAQLLAPTNAGLQSTMGAKSRTCPRRSPKVPNTDSGHRRRLEHVKDDENGPSIIIC